MAQSYTEIYIHAIWATKNREPILTDAILKELKSFIWEISNNNGIGLLNVNGYLDHIHILFYLNPTQNISQVIQQIKGASSKKYYNSEKPLYWQNGYSAFSVSRWDKQKIFDYIKSQRLHHRENSTISEFENLD